MLDNVSGFGTIRAVCAGLMLNAWRTEDAQKSEARVVRESGQKQPPNAGSWGALPCSGSDVGLGYTNLGLRSTILGIWFDRFWARFGELTAGVDQSRGAFAPLYGGVDQT